MFEVGDRVEVFVYGKWRVGFIVRRNPVNIRVRIELVDGRRKVVNRRRDQVRVP